MINMIKRNEAEILVPIISAYAEGRILQYKEEEGWRDIEDSEGLSINTIIKQAENYRIKPEVKYRPFKDQKECWAEMLKHQPFGWVKDRNGSKFVIENVDPRGFVEVYDEGTCTFKDVFENRTFVDGLPFGIKVEE